MDILARTLEWPEVDQYTKPLLMPILIYYLIERTEGKVYKYHLVLGGALIFSWIGDVLLMWDGELNFMLGLGSFLIAQIIYFIVFRLDIQISEKGLLTKRAPFLIMLLAAGAFFLYLVLPHVGAVLQIAIPIYSICLLLMATGAILRNTAPHGYKEVVAGAVIFVVSDSTLAYNQFVAAIPYGSSIVMLTYIVAQFLIVQGVARKDLLTSDGK